MQILCKLHPTPGGQERKGPARAHRAEEGRFCHMAQARQTVFLLPEPCGGQSRLSAALPCDDLRQTPISGPGDPSLPEVKDPTAVASSLRATPIHPHPPPCKRPCGGREGGRKGEGSGRSSGLCQDSTSGLAHSAEAGGPLSQQLRGVIRGWGSGGEGAPGAHTGGRKARAKGSWDSG